MRPGARGSRLEATRRGVSLVEIVIAIFVFVMCVIPVVGLFNLGYESASFSEDRIYAETLASRILEVWNGQTYETLAGLVGKPVDDVVQRIFNTDKVRDWFTELPEYAKNLGVGQNYFRGVLDVVEVDKGLLSLEITVQWTVLEGGKQGETRQYKLLGFRAREDLSVDSRDGNTLEE